MFSLTRTKIRLLLATAVLSLILIGPVMPPFHNSDCAGSSSGSCTG